MSRRVIDLTSPGGHLKTDEIESFVNKTAKTGRNWQTLFNKTASLFLMERGWPFDQDTRPSFVFSSMNSEKIDIKKYHTRSFQKKKHGRNGSVFFIPGLNKLSHDCFVNSLYS